MKLIVDSCVFIDAFDPQSKNYQDSISLLNYLRRTERLITMPAHGWFEVQCALQNLQKQNRYVGPEIQGAMGCEIELIHIDDKFITKYAMVDIPYTKSGDHIFIAVAKVNGYELITNDQKMYEISQSIGIRAFILKEYLREKKINT